MRSFSLFLLMIGSAAAQSTVVRPKMIDDVLVNP